MFLAQIVIADPPPDLWGGLVPRTGSLAFFAAPCSTFRTVAVPLGNGDLRERAHPSRLRSPLPFPDLRRGFAAEPLAVSADPDDLPLLKWPVRASPSNRRKRLKKRSGNPVFTPLHWHEVVAMLQTMSVRRIVTGINPTTRRAEHRILPSEPVLAILPILKHYPAFEHLSRVEYAADPDRLPTEVRAALAPVRQHDAQYEVSSMGGQVNLSAYYTASRKDPVCLIEILRSDLVGSRWHDLSSFGVFFDPESLAEDRLDRAVGEVSESSTQTGLTQCGTSPNPTNP